MIIWFLGFVCAALALFVLVLLADGLRNLLARLRAEARGRAARQSLGLVVRGREDHAADLFSLILAHPCGRRLPRFRAGQYLTLRTPEGARRYSLAAWTARPREYRLGIRRLEGGRVSGWLHEHARPGQILEVLPPAGDFVLDSGADEVVLVGGGIGLTPLAAMVDALERKAAGRVWLFHAARTRPELLGHDHYAGLARRGHGFRYRPILSRPDADWSGLRGRLKAADLVEELAHPGRAAYYLCARQDMMDELMAGLTALGVPPEHIHRESFGSIGNTDTGEYRVEVAGHGRHVFRGEPSLLHALEAWGVPVRSDCRAGECGACGIHVRRGGVRACQATRAEVPEGMALACCVLPASDLEIALR